MPKYYCDYCDTYLTHDSPSVRRTHNQGRNHKENVRMYYQQWMEEQAQKLIDQTTAAFKSGKFSSPAAQAVAMAAMHGAQSTLNYRAATVGPAGGPAGIAMPPNGLMQRMHVPQGAYFYPPGGVPMMGPPRFAVRPGGPFPIRMPPGAPEMSHQRMGQITLPHHQMAQMHPQQTHPHIQNGPPPQQYVQR